MVSSAHETMYRSTEASFNLVHAPELVVLCLHAEPLLYSLLSSCAGAAPYAPPSESGKHAITPRIKVERRNSSNMPATASRSQCAWLHRLTKKPSGSPTYHSHSPNPMGPNLQEKMPNFHFLRVPEQVHNSGKQFPWPKEDTHNMRIIKMLRNAQEMLCFCFTASCFYE